MDKALRILDFGFWILDWKKEKPEIQNPKSKIQNLSVVTAF
jgi:hypothetical protein